MPLAAASRSVSIVSLCGSRLQFPQSFGRFFALATGFTNSSLYSPNSRGYVQFSTCSTQALYGSGEFRKGIVGHPEAPVQALYFQRAIPLVRFAKSRTPETVFRGWAVGRLTWAYLT